MKTEISPCQIQDTTKVKFPFLSQFENIPTNLHIGGFDHVRQTEQDETIQRDLIHGIAVLACQWSIITKAKYRFTMMRYSLCRR